MLRRPWQPIIVLVALWAPGTVQAQRRDSTSYWAASGELSYTDVSGNRSLALLSTGLGVRRAGGRRLEAGISLGMRYGRSDGEVAAESYAAEITARFRPRAWVSPFVYAKGERDLIKALDLRVSAAAGLDLNLVPHPERRVSVGMALQRDYERRLLGAGSTEPSRVNSTRLILRLLANPTIRRGVTAEHRTQYEPVADDLGNYLFASTTSVRVLLTGGLSLQTSYQYTYDSSPVEGVRSRSDRTLTTGLIVEVR